MKKLLFFVERLSTGGAERVVTALANELCDRSEYQVYVLTYLAKEKKEYFLHEKVIRLEMPTFRGSRFRTIYQKYCYLRKIVKKINPYAVYSLAIPKTNIILSLAIRDRKFPFVISERNDPERFPSNYIMKKIRDLTYKKCEKLVFQTPGARDYFSGEIRKKGMVICNPVSDFLPARYTGRRQHRIVNFCRIEPQKNLGLTIKAFKAVCEEFSDYTLEFYGDGSERERLEAYVIDLGLEGRVIFHGYAAEIYSKVYKAALFVSSSDFEGISNSMLEAVSMGIPTICTDCPPGGAKMTICDGINGLLVPVGSAEKLAEAMRRALGSEKLMESLSIEGARLREQLQVKQIADKWLSVVEEIV